MHNKRISQKNNINDANVAETVPHAKNASYINRNNQFYVFSLNFFYFSTAS